MKINIKKAIAAGAGSSLLLAVGSEILIRTQTSVRYLQPAKNIFLILFTILALLSIFLIIKTKHGVGKAIIYTILIAAAIAFLIGALLVCISLFMPQGAGYTALRSLYYYLLGIIVALISLCVAILDLFALVIMKIVVSVKNKHHKFN